MIKRNVLFPAKSCSHECDQALANESGHLGSGAFCKVFALDNHRVVKFSWDLETLQFLQRLSGRSIHFPRVEALLENQANDQDGMIFHAAIIERLEPYRSPWVTAIVDRYRQKFRPESAAESKFKLLSLSHDIRENRLSVPGNEAGGLIQCLQILGDECVSANFIADLRADSNLMRHVNGHLVIADPAHPKRHMT